MKRLEDLRQRIKTNLRDNILSFWTDHMVDQAKGGFYGRISNDMKLDRQADKGLVLNTRILWTYSAAYNCLGDQAYLRLAHRAYDYLQNYFWDKDNKGGYWMLDYRGRPKESEKLVYGQAFMIYALAEYYKASQDRESLDMAIDLYRTLEAKATDPIYRGYLEGFSANWDYKKGLLISDGEHKDSEKTMNTHLHLLEAYTNLLRVWEDEGLKDRLRQLVDIMTDLVLNKESWHFDVYFDRQWGSLTDLVSYGHDIEGSWLLTEAAEVLADRDYIKKVEQISLNIAQTVLDQGLDIDGGLFNEGTRQGPHDRDKYWWPQAEALVGFFNAYQISQDQAYLDACIKCWDFIDSKLVDHKNGEWFEYIDIGGQLAGPDEAKADEWKCPYHNSRACMELLTRLNKKINKK